MVIPNPYFKNVPDWGDLQMEQVIVDYVYPLLSVLKDGSGKRYLCMCFDTRGAQQWLITFISNSVLIDLLNNKVTLAAPFEDSRTRKLRVVMDYHTRAEDFQFLNAAQISKEELPEAEEYLDAEPNEWAEYIRMLSPLDGQMIRGNCVRPDCGRLGEMAPIRWGDIHSQDRKEGGYVVRLAS